MTDKIDEFIAESKKMIGKKVEEPKPAVTYVSMRMCRMFSVCGLGSLNPLFVDPSHGTNSKYGCMVAPQTFLAAVHSPAAEGAYNKEDYGLAKFFTAADYEWFDVVRCGDSFTTSLELKDVLDKTVGGKRTAQLVSEASYWNQHKELVGTCRGTLSMIPLKRGEEMLVDRKIYTYSEKEIASISHDLDSEVSRGAASLYWEEVEKGDKLTPVVKGPVGLSDIMGWRQTTSTVDFALEIQYRKSLKDVGKRRVNPTTLWPYWNEDQNYEDYFASKASGMSLPWVHGLHRASLAEDLLVKWMSDEGFIKRLSFETPALKPFFYQDVNWYKGEVVDKYKEKLGDNTYKAVDVKIEVTNELGERTATGNATVYLSSKGQEVKLPVPH